MQGQLIFQQSAGLLNEVTALLPHLWPEVALVVGLLVTLLIGITPLKHIRVLAPLVGIAALTAFVALQLFGSAADNWSGNMLKTDGVTRFYVVFVAAAGLLTFTLAHFSAHLRKHPLILPEFSSLLLAMVLGATLMVKSANLLMLYISIELVSICSYISVLLYKQVKPSAEAALKYVLFGAVASGVMLYGMSFLYGLAGTLVFTDPAFGLMLQQAPTGLLVTAIVLTFAGFLFKAGAAPMHIWVPDVYEGAPVALVPFFSTAPKIAAVLVVARFMPSQSAEVWQPFLLPVLSAVALASLVIGTFAALRQTTVKRMLAYGSVAHIGYLLLPVLGAGSQALVPVLVYALAYLVGTFGVFAAIQALENQQPAGQFTNWDGVGKSKPVLGIALVLQMVALIGLPPTGGFIGKFLVFTALYSHFEQLNSAWLLWLLGIALLFTLVSLVYYLQVPFRMFFKRNENQKAVVIPIQELGFMAALALVQVVLFVKADWLTEFVLYFVAE